MELREFYYTSYPRFCFDSNVVGYAVPAISLVQTRWKLGESFLSYVYVNDKNRFVEVPEVRKVKKYVDKFVEKTQEQIVEVPKIEYVDKIVEVPQIRKVQKFVEVPKIQYVDKIVDVPKIITTEKIIEIAKTENVEVVEETQYENVDLGTEQEKAPVEREEVCCDCGCSLSHDLCHFVDT